MTGRQHRTPFGSPLHARGVQRREGMRPPTDVEGMEERDAVAAKWKMHTWIWVGAWPAGAEGGGEALRGGERSGRGGPWKGGEAGPR